MKSLLISFSLIFGSVFISSAQVANAAENLKSQAEKMGIAFISQDFKTFAKFTHPIILKSMGGEAKMTASIKKTISDLKKQGMSFSKITFDNPAEIIKSGKEIQTIINQQTELKLTQGRLVATSTLIAVSYDNGVNWTFIDTANRDIKVLRKSIPTISSKIVLPAPTPPVKYDL